VVRRRCGITIRRWMAAVLALAVLFCTDRLMTRRAHFLRLADAHASRAHDYGAGRGGLCPVDDWYDERGMPTDDWFAHCDRIRDYSTSMERKYRSAAARPWLAVKADPPFPTR
jgi:hypothetical protein